MIKTVHFEAIESPAIDKIWFCGDVHGQYDLLLTALRAAGFDPRRGHRLYACGDLIDTGPQSAEMMDLMHTHWFRSVEGNHERMMMQALSGWDPVRYDAVMNYLHRQGGAEIMAQYAQGVATIDTITAFTDAVGTRFGRWLLKGGGGWFLAPSMSFERQAQLLNAWLSARAPRVIEVRAGISTFGVVHAQPLSDHWQDTSMGSGRGVEQILQWSRTDFHQFVGDGTQGAKQPGARVHGVDAVILGHCIIPTQQPVVCENRLYLDVGAKNGVLPCVMNAEDVLARIRREAAPSDGMLSYTVRC